MSVLVKRKAENQDIEEFSPKKKKRKKYVIKLPPKSIQNLVPKVEVQHPSIPEVNPKTRVSNKSIPQIPIGARKKKIVLDSDYVPDPKPILFPGFGLIEDPKLKFFSGTFYRAYMLVCELMNSRDGLTFLNPVPTDTEYTKNYYEVVKKPMWFSKVLQKMKTRKYKSLLEWKEDMELIFSNACLFNASGNWVYDEAKKLETRFKEVWNLELCKKTKEKLYQARPSRRIHNINLLFESTPAAVNIRHTGAQLTFSQILRNKKAATEAKARKNKKNNQKKKTPVSSKMKKKTKRQTSSSKKKKKEPTKKKTPQSSKINRNLYPSPHPRRITSQKQIVCTKNVLGGKNIVLKDGRTVFFNQNPISEYSIDARKNLLNEMKSLTGHQWAIVLDIYRRKEGDVKEVDGQLSLNFAKMKDETYEILDYYVHDYLLKYPDGPTNTIDSPMEFRNKRSIKYPLPSFRRIEKKETEETEEEYERKEAARMEKLKKAKQVQMAGKMQKEEQILIARQLKIAEERKRQMAAAAISGDLVNIPPESIPRNGDFRAKEITTHMTITKPLFEDLEKKEVLENENLGKI